MKLVYLMQKSAISANAGHNPMSEEDALVMMVCKPGLNRHFKGAWLWQ